MTWTPAEIRRTYGLDDDSAKTIPEEKKAEVVRKVLEVFDKDGDGDVSLHEWMDGWAGGKRLLDFGVGFAGGLFLLFFLGGGRGRGGDGDG